jgi:hypothetical protein
MTIERRLNTGNNCFKIHLNINATGNDYNHRQSMNPAQAHRMATGASIVPS